MRGNTWQISLCRSLKQAATLSIHNQQLNEQDFDVVGELASVSAQIVITSWYLARIGQLNILWTVSTLARAVTKCNRACDQRLPRLIGYTHCTEGF